MSMLKRDQRHKQQPKIKMQNISLGEKIYNRIGLLGYNNLITWIPSHLVRLGWLRLFGAKIGTGTSIFRGTTVFDIKNLVIGDHCGVGFRCLLDARAGITIGNDVILASDTQIIGGYHDVNSPHFYPVLRPTVIEDYVWLASRVTVIGGFTIGRGAVAAAAACITRDVPPLAIVGGVPAKVIGERDENALKYHIKYRPLFY